MAEITSSDGVIKKLQEFDKYVGQSLEVLKALRGIKEDAETLTRSISEKKSHLAMYEQELSAILKKAESVSKQADAIIAPMLKEKEELERLDKKLTEGLTRLDATLESKIEEGLTLHSELVKKEMGRLIQERKELQEQADAFFKNILKNSETELAKLLETQERYQVTVNESILTIRKEIETQIADFLYKQNALVSNLSQQIDSYRRLTESLKSSIEKQSNQISHLENQNAELQQTIEKQNKEFADRLSDLRDGKVQLLEKDIMQMKTTLNDVTTKLNNMKFKKILGL